MLSKYRYRYQYYMYTVPEVKYFHFSDVFQLIIGFNELSQRNLFL
jgi:hypothetical protein